jgi:pyruvate,water dikinase
LAEVLGAYAALGSPLVAVRSSAVEEDAFERSLAGAYTTVLNVQGDGELLAAIETCIAAYHSDTACQLRKDYGAPAAGLALIVQTMAPALAAGVLFTSNPVNGHLGESLVSATWGLGEPLVSGRVTPDEFVVRRSDKKVLSQTVGDKAFILAAGHGEREQPRTQREDRPSLTPGQLAELVALGVRVEQHFGFPQDIEWALTEDGFVLLQSRPIPTLAAAYYNRKLELWAGNDDAGELPGTLWSRAYSDEIWTKPTSPLFYTTHNLSGTFAWYFGTVGNTAKLPEAVFRYHRAAAYVDVRYLEEQLAYQPKFARIEGLLNLLPPERRAAVKQAPWRWRGRLRQIRTLERSPDRAQSVFKVHKLVKAQWPAWLHVVRRWREIDLATLNDGALLAHLGEVHAESAKVGMPCAVGVLFHGYDLTLLLQGMLDSWLPDEPGAFGLLTSALEESETVTEAHAIWRLSRQALEDVEATQALREARWEDLRQRLAGSERGQRLLQGIDDFLATHYHRGANYKDVIWPRWGDDPHLLLATLRIYLDPAMEDPAVAHRRQRARRIEATNSVLRRLRAQLPLGPLKEQALRYVLKYAQIYLAHRDNHRFYYDHAHWEVRRTFREMGARLAARGALDAPDDVFFLGQDEVTAALSGGLSLEEALRRARVRKRWFESADPMGSPRFLHGDEPIEEGTETEAAEGRRLTGVAASAGSATAVARVVLNVQDLGRVGRGEVLVANQTDPGWTPVFSRIGALVMETGSVLAHGTTLCREYGLPAVTGVAGATSSIRDGDLVRVDGSHGNVTVLSAGGEG